MTANPTLVNELDNLLHPRLIPGILFDDKEDT